MDIPEDLMYTETHEWVKVDGNTVTIGVTDFAQNQLSDLTFVELAKNNGKVQAGDELAVLESVKTASEVYAPISGNVIEVNGALEDTPELINSDPFGDGWICRIETDETTDIDTLMSPEQYEASLPDE